MTVYIRRSMMSTMDDFGTGNHEIQYRFRIVEPGGLDVQTFDKVLLLLSQNMVSKALESMGHEGVEFAAEPPSVPV